MVQNPLNIGIVKVLVWYSFQRKGTPEVLAPFRTVFKNRELNKLLINYIQFMYPLTPK